MADPCTEFESGRGDGVVASSAQRFLEAECVVVNADLAAAEVSLLPSSLRRSGYAERSELSVSDVAAKVSSSVALAANTLRDVAAGVAVAMKTVAGTAAPGVADPWGETSQVSRELDRDLRVAPGLLTRQGPLEARDHGFLGFREGA